jgi:hypothetical protein
MGLVRKATGAHEEERMDPVIDDEVAERISATLDRLGFDPMQRALYLAIEAEALGPGGAAAVARVAGVGESVVRLGLAELRKGDATDSK